MGAGTLEGIPPSAESTFERLLGAAAREPAVLRRSIDRYLEAIIEAAQTRTHLDTKLAAAITKSCHGLIDELPGASPENQRRIIAAVEYYLLPRDGEDDLAYVDGLDDDALVVTAVAASLGRPDLAVPVPVR
jgi:uncharacterized membrane protein YkvA (DUF1232 family)